MRTVRTIMLAAAWLYLTTTSAGAATIVYNGQTAVAGGLYEYSYTFDISGNSERLEAGNYFTIYDFAGYTSVFSLPANWVFSTQPLGVTPAGATPSDSAAILNLTFTYSGPTTQLDQGLFRIRSIYQTTNPDSYVALTIKNTGADAGQTQLQQGSTTVPMAPAADATVPEPGSLLLLGSGLVLAASRMRRGRRRQNQ